MNAQTNKDKLTRDYEGKQTSYFESNYRKKTKANYLRRLRNDLINEAVNKVTSCEKVLDAGCGPAILFEDLLKRSGKYYALDIVQANLDEVKKNNADTNNIEYILSDVDSLEWEPDYFDVIICSGSIEYHQNPEKNLSRFIQLLKPGGTLLCSFPNVTAPYRIWGEYVFKYFWYMKNKLMGASALLYPRKLFSARKVEKISLNEAGVDSVKTRYFGWRVFLQPFDSIFRGLDYRIIRGYEEGRHKYLRVFCTEFLLVVNKQAGSAKVAAGGDQDV